MKRFLFFLAVLFTANLASAQGQILITNNTPCSYTVQFALYNSNCSQVIYQTYMVPPMGTSSVMTLPPPPGFTIDVASVKSISNSSDICDTSVTVQTTSANCTTFPSVGTGSSCCVGAFSVDFTVPGTLQIG